MTSKLLIALLVLLVSPLAQAQTVRYVTDVLETPLRAGASNQHKIVRSLPSGTLLHVLGNDPKTGYTRVRINDGTQGWILTTQLMDKPAARQELEDVKAERANLKTQLNTLITEKNKLETEYAKLRESSQSLNLELAQFRKIASGEIDFDAQNKALQARVIQLERELRVLQQENRSLLEKGSHSLFVTGALVLLAGLILGLFLPRLGASRRDHWKEL